MLEKRSFSVGGMGWGVVEDIINLKNYITRVRFTGKGKSCMKRESYYIASIQGKTFYNIIAWKEIGCVNICACTYTHTQTYIRIRIHIYIRTYTPTYTRAHMQICTCKHI